MSIINISIDLTKLDKSRIVEKNGKKYLNLTVDKLRETDKFGNTHSVYVRQSEEERKAKTPKSYLGGGKEYVFNNNQQQQAPPPQQQHYQQPSNNNSSDDQLPF